MSTIEDRLVGRDSVRADVSDLVSDKSIYRNVGKRVLDLVFCLVALPLILPLMIALYFIVRRDGGPFLFVQQRLGKDGKSFGCLKIRTMVPNAEDVLQELIDSSPELAAEWAENFKLENDPRITEIGHFLRKTSLDELPQIFNVMMGDMSLVGPRPITDEEIVRYGDSMEIYYSVRPGLTGPWQISGRREADYGSRALQDLRYVSSVNFFSDLFYIFATVPEVVMAKGR